MNVSPVTMKTTFATAVVVIAGAVWPAAGAAEQQPQKSDQGKTPPAAQPAAPQKPAPPAADKPATPPASSSPSADKKPSSLDELLGIGEEKKDQGAADAAARDSNDQLKRELSAAEVADAFTQAVQKMSLSAELLDTRFDPGLGTQRVQEDIIAKLNMLIDQAKKNQCKGGSSSSSASPQQAKSESQPKNAGNKPQPAKPKPPGEQRSNKANDSQEGASPPLQQGDVNTVLEEGRTEWGSLPARMRDQLMQGKYKDRFSSLYNQLTAEYYKRLAEESAP